MILIPELETVVILVPRTASGALRRAITAAYPRSIQLYRHMEADGVPSGYDRWRRIGVVRDPIDRLWSLYKFLQTFGEGKKFDPVTGAWPPSYVAEQRATVDGLSFSRWIVENQSVFTHPYITGDTGFRPFFTVRHPIPETRKSQFVYIRPDLGAEAWPYARVSELAAELAVELGGYHATERAAVPPLDARALEHVRRYFAWDLAATATARAA